MANDAEVFTRDDIRRQGPDPDDLRAALAAIDAGGFGDCVDDDAIIEEAARAYLALLTHDTVPE